MTDAEVKALQDEKTRLEGELEKQKGRVANGEAQIAKWSNEMGEERKKLDAALEASRAQEAMVSKWKQEIEDIKKTISVGAASGSGSTSTGQGAGIQKDDPDAVESSLTDIEKKNLDAVYDSVMKKAQSGDEEAVKVLDRIKSDKTFRATFMLGAKQEPATGLPVTWRKTPAKKEDDAEKVVMELFKNANKKSSFMPDGSNGRENESAGRGGPSNRKEELGEWSQKIKDGIRPAGA